MDGMDGQSTHMVQIEISQQLLDGLPLKFCTDIDGALRMNPNYFGDPLSFHSTTMRLTFVVLSEIAP